MERIASPYQLSRYWDWVYFERPIIPNGNPKKRLDWCANNDMRPDDYKDY
jgi:hypothetical protein